MSRAKTTVIGCAVGWCTANFVYAAIFQRSWNAAIEHSFFTAGFSLWVIWRLHSLEGQ